MRSLLFVPADSERKLAKALATGADALILDLEDAVTPENRPQARARAAEFIRATLPLAQRPLIYVRINPIDSADAEADLFAIVPAAPDGVMQPKPNSGRDVHRLSIALGHAEERAGLQNHRINILPVVTETPASVLQLASYTDASSRVIGMTWGSEDLSAAVGAFSSRTPARELTSPFRLVRNLCLMTAAAAGVEPIDTVFVDFRDTEGLQREAREAARDGFTGKIAIHPEQVGPINEAFTPCADEIARAEAIVNAFAATPGAGVTSLNGQMLDRPHLKLAQRILARARAAGAAAAIPPPPSQG